MLICKRRKDTGEKDKFVQMYQFLARQYNLSTKLKPPEALREKADEFERFLSVVFTCPLTRYLEKEIRFLRGLAKILECKDADPYTYQRSSPSSPGRNLGKVSRVA